MAIERACVQVACKPWGVADLRPWSSIVPGDPVGELWFQRADKDAPSPALLVKLLFTSEPLSIQVHPDDEFARSIGLPNGKTEAWYILAAVPGARVALGLKRHLTPQQLHEAIGDGSIAGLVQWLPVAKGDIVYVPAGTIHAIGAGIVLAEIQQRSDTTFRLFDYGRHRELHEDSAVAVATAGPIQAQPASRRLTAERTILVASPHFVIERIELPANSSWALDAIGETWILAIEGSARIGPADLAVGEAVFVETDRAGVAVGPAGMSGLIAYPGPDAVVALLRRSEEPMTARAGNPANSLASMETPA